MGGFPYWLLNKYPQIQLRTDDAGLIFNASDFFVTFDLLFYWHLDYKREVAKWYTVLMTRMQKFLYGNGGPIIMVQVREYCL